MSFLDQAKIHIDRSQLDEAVQQLGLHLNDNFYDEEALFMLGGALIGKGMNGIAAAVTQQAIEIRRKKGMPFYEAMANLAACFKGEHNDGTAEEIWKIALGLAPDATRKAEILANMGGCHVNAGRPQKALDYYNQAIAERDDIPKVYYNRGLANLELANWRQGWADYHSGFKSGDRNDRRYRGLPEWDGSPGKTLIIWGEQGVGDEILHVSVLADAIKICKRVILDCHPRLEALFRRSFPGLEIHGTRKTLSQLDWLENCDAEASLAVSSLPMFFRNRTEDFPGTPYLAPDREEVIRLRGEAKRPRIGISWAGGTKRTRSDLRSIPLAAWLPIFRAVPDAEFYSLQYTKDAAREVCEFEETTGVTIKHWPGWVECTDYDRTASFVASMDRVITVCGTAFHIGGALGVPTMCLAPHAAAWRYCNGPKSPWYGSAHIYRQKAGETWEPTIQQVADDLTKLYSAQRQAA